MNNTDGTEQLEKAGSFFKDAGEWLSTHIPIAQTYVWWVAAVMLLLAVLLSVRWRRQLVRPKALVPHTWRSRQRLNPSVSGMRHARR
ncbi:hypothetical protein D3C73_19660 [compost metagenome]